VATDSELPLIIKALDFAAKKHRDQRRMDAAATPYINHPIELAELLVNEGGIADINIIVAAILHDTVEDTDTTAQQLERIFGNDIKNIVIEVTDDKSLAKEERKHQQIEHAATCSQQAKLVKLADKICNLRDILESPPTEWSLARKQEYFDWSKRVVDQIRGTHADLESLFDEAYEKRP